MSKKEKTKEVVKPTKVTHTKATCNLSKEHKGHMALLYKGKMHKDILKDLGAPDKERVMMMHEIKRPGGYTGV